MSDERVDSRESLVASDSPLEQGLSRRRALKVLGAAVAAPIAIAEAQQGQPEKPRQTHDAPHPPASNTRQPTSQARARFFTARERQTMSRLADDIIPKDERSGSATESGAIEFIDFNLSVEETSADTRTQWRGGIRWLDEESRKRFGKRYHLASEAQRHQILEDISWPDRVKPEHRHGAAFFGRARDMVAAGFFSSAMGYKDLQYIGNTFVPRWNGCPAEAMQKIGVSLDLMSNTKWGK